MRHVKIECTYCPPPPHGGHHHHHDRETHPSWIGGMEALHAYGDWVSSVVLPVAFQWIEEHKAEVYASVPDNCRDDVGVVMAAAFRLVRELPAYQAAQQKCKGLETEGTDSSKINPVWSGIAKKVRSCTEEAFREQSALLGDGTK